MKTYCVTVAIIRDGNEYFIAKRATTKQIAPDQWEFITGFVEDHEAAEDTIVREIREEINTSGTIIGQLDIVQMHKPDERWILVPFLVSVPTRHIQTETQEHSAGKWVAWKELARLPAADFRYDVGVFEKALKHHDCSHPLSGLPTCQCRDNTSAFLAG